MDESFLVGGQFAVARKHGANLTQFVWSCRCTYENQVLDHQSTFWTDD